MNTKINCHGSPRSAKVVSRFGQACLIQIAGGQYRLEGGNEEDYAAAQEWASLFAHDVVFSQPLTCVRRSRACLPRTLAAPRFPH